MNTANDKPQTAADDANSPTANNSAAAPVSRPDRRGPGLLLIGHGTREHAGVEEFLSAAKQIGAMVAPLPTEACFLELAEPTIDAAVARLAAAGVGELLVAPLILFAAGHAKRDIPAAVAAAAARHSVVVAEQLPPLGCRPELSALSARRYREAVGVENGRGGEIGPEQTALLMVGRGSNDPEATAEMHRFAKLRHEAAPTARLEVGFTAMAEPSLDTALETVGRLPVRRVVVQPHLLFTGQLLEKVRAGVAAAAERFPDRQWIVTGHLGPEPEITAAIASDIFSRLSAGNGVEATSGNASP